MANKNKNWKQLSKQQSSDTMKNRDVYGDQQLERSRIEEKQKPTSRIIFTAIVAVLVAAAAYLLGIGISMGGANMTYMSDRHPYYTVQEKYETKVVPNEYGTGTHREQYPVNYYYELDEEGKMVNKDKGYKKVEDVPVPEWYTKQEKEFEEMGYTEENLHSFEYWLYRWDWLAVGLALVSGIFTYAILYQVMMRNLDAQNMMSDTSDINQYQNDQHIALPEEVQRKFDWFPDVGAHSHVQVSSMISHMALKNKGLKKVDLADRAKSDMKDSNGNIEYYKGEALLDSKGEIITKSVPIIDEQFMDDLFEASGDPNEPDIRKYYDTTKIPYNPDNKDRDKLPNYKTVADLINGDWEFPVYEPQRPAGAYIVDTAPVNTMVLAITRAGKGQTVIEPTLDMWTREINSHNMVVNDPKGELLVKFYVRATVRGFQVVQFNLINAMKTDIYNPLGMAADAAREGDSTKCALYVENIAEVFFPVDGGDDPVWPNAANNAFKRAAYGLIDYYIEEEKELRAFAEKTGMSDKLLETKIDNLWGKVTLYNCYQLFVQLTSKKKKNPISEFSDNFKNKKVRLEDGTIMNIDDVSTEEFNELKAKASAEGELWEGKPEADLLTLYFNATDALPKNSMRTLVSNANNALRSMGGAEKMMASCRRFLQLKAAA